MVSQLVAPSFDFSQCQLAPVIPPSLSVKVAVIDSPTSGSIIERVTSPGSSTFSNSMVTAVLSSMAVSWLWSAALPSDTWTTTSRDGSVS